MILTNYWTIVALSFGIAMAGLTFTSEIISIFNKSTLKLHLREHHKQTDTKVIWKSLPAVGRRPKTNAAEIAVAQTDSDNICS